MDLNKAIGLMLIAAFIYKLVDKFILKRNYPGENQTFEYSPPPQETSPNSIEHVEQTPDGGWFASEACNTDYFASNYSRAEERELLTAINNSDIFTIKILDEGDTQEKEGFHCALFGSSGHSQEKIPLITHRQTSSDSDTYLMTTKFIFKDEVPVEKQHATIEKINTYLSQEDKIFSKFVFSGLINDRVGMITIALPLTQPWMLGKFILLIGFLIKAVAYAKQEFACEIEEFKF